MKKFYHYLDVLLCVDTQLNGSDNSQFNNLYSYCGFVFLSMLAMPMVATELEIS